MPARRAMSITLTERQGVVVSSSTVASSSRCRVARPRCPGTRPSVVTASDCSEGTGESTSAKSSLTAVTQRASGAVSRLRGRLAGRLGPAVRAALVIPSALALATVVSGNTQVQIFAAFGGFALTIFAGFPGGWRTQLRSLGLLVLVGAAFIAVGTACSQEPVAAVVAMGVVGFAVLFSGILGPQASAGTVAALLAFVLPVAVAGPPGEIPDRLWGWLLAAVLALPATAVLWPRHDRRDLRRHLAGTARALGALVSAHAEGRLDPAALAAADAEMAGLQRLYDSTAFPPTGAGPGDSALAKLVGRMEWAGTNAVLSHRQAGILDLPDVTRVHAAVAEVLTAAADALEGDRSGGEAADRLARATARLRTDQLASQDASLRRLLDGTVEDRVTAALALDRSPGPGGPAGDPDGPDRPDRPEGSAGDPVGPGSGAGWRDDGDRLLGVLDPTFRTRALAFATLLVAAAAAEASRPARPAGAKGWWRVRTEWASVRAAAVAHASPRSVWFRNSVRGAAGLALAVAVVEVTNVGHGFWVILATLSVLRSNALGTEANVVRALAGTVVGFVVGAAIMLGLGNHTDLLWAVFPVAVLFSAVAPTAISFAAGQAAFTVAVVVLFNIVQPTGWRVGLTRIEDIAIGCAVSLAVGVLFWPRGAAAALGQALSDAYSAGSDYLARVVDRTTSLDDDLDTEPARRATDAPFRRLDDAMRQYMAERGAKPVPPATVARLAIGASRTRVAAYSLGTLPRRPVDTQGPALLGSTDRAGQALRDAGAEVRGWYHAMADVLAGRSAEIPPVVPRGSTLHPLLLSAFEEGLRRRRARDVRIVLRMLWVDESLEDQLALRQELREVAARVARRPTFWNRF